MEHNAILSKAKTYGEDKMSLLKTLKILKYILIVWVVIHGIRAIIVLSMFILGSPDVDIFGGSMIALVIGIIVYRIIDQELNNAKNTSEREL